MTPHGQPVDAAHLASLRALYGAENFARLRGIFLDETRDRVAELRGAAAAGDGAAVKRVAHRMVSLLGAFGARAPAELARAVADSESGDVPAGAEPLARATEAARDAVLELGDAGDGSV